MGGCVLQVSPNEKWGELDDKEGLYNRWIKTLQAGQGGFVHAADQPALVAEIDKKCEEWTMLPRENSEPLQVVRYGITLPGDMT